MAERERSPDPGSRRRGLALAVRRPTAPRSRSRSSTARATTTGASRRASSRRASRELEGALREVHEETGYRVQPGRSLGEVRYLKKSGGGAREKVVHYWAMRAIGGAFSPEPRGRRAALAAARRGADACHAGHRPRGAGALPARAPCTGSVLLVRHASAGSRPSGRGRPAAPARRGRAGAGRGAGAAAVAVRGREDRVRRLPALRPDAATRSASRSASRSTRSRCCPSRAFPEHEDEALELSATSAGAGARGRGCSQGDVIQRWSSASRARTTYAVGVRSSAKKGGVWALSFDDHRLSATRSASRRRGSNRPKRPSFTFGSTGSTQMLPARLRT